MLAFLREGFLVLFIDNLECNSDTFRHGSVQIVAILNASDYVLQLLLKLEVQVLAAVVSAKGASMAVKYRIIAGLHSIVEIEHLLHVARVVLHVVALASVSDQTGVVPFDLKLERTDAERIARKQVVMLVVE